MADLPAARPVDRRSPELRVAVLLPCRNEERTVGRVVADFRTALPHARVAEAWFASILSGIKADAIVVRLEVG